MSADTNWDNYLEEIKKAKLEEIKKAKIEACLKLPSFFIQDEYLKFLKKETKNFEKEVCGNWEHEHEIPKMIKVGIVGAGSENSKQRFPDIELDSLINYFLESIEENSLPYELRKGKQMEDILFPFSFEPIEPVNLREKVEQIAQQMPPFEKPKPKKKAKVSDFKKRINSFLRKK